MSIPREMLVDTMKSMATFAGHWNEELPLRIHSRAISEGGGPEWHPEFARWLGKGNHLSDRGWRDNPEPRVQTTRAFRKLRKVAVREYEVVYRTAILKIPFDETVTWLNERAIRNNKEDRYTEEDALMLLVCGVDKIASWVTY